MTSNNSNSDDDNARSNVIDEFPTCNTLEAEDIAVEDDFGFPLRIPDVIWTSIGEPNAHFSGIWLGLGLLSDAGLPIDALHMFLAAKSLSRTSQVDVLLADIHAVTSGADSADVQRRAEARRLELRAIAKLLNIEISVHMGSELAKDPEYLQQLQRVREWLAVNYDSPVTEYTIMGIADDLFFDQQEKLKIGWSYEPEIRVGRGRHHEAETDMIALRINPTMRARYVRHGVTLDSHRPKAVPYTESGSTALRLMLTGADAGKFRSKLHAESVTRTRREAVLHHLDILVNAFALLVKPFDGDVVTRAESIQEQLQNLLSEDISPPRNSFVTGKGDVLRELRERGLVHQCTDMDGLERHLEQPRRVYCGFDPTAPSLTVGNLVPILVLAHFQRAGHTPVVVLGGGTGLIGDPSGKTAERPLLGEDTVRANIAAQRSIFEKILQGNAGADSDVIFLDNAEWLAELTLLGALRDIGKHVNVNELMHRDAIRERMNRQHGLSLTEFFYPVLQAWDFRVLLEKHSVTVQLGGTDQWGNIVGGVDLIRRLSQKPVFGITNPLVTRSDGGKFGKTEVGPIWLSADRTSPYQLFQFFLKTTDSDVGMYLRLFTFLSLDEISKLERQHLDNLTVRYAQRVLAREVTTVVHGRHAAETAERAADALFGGNVTDIPADMITDVVSGVPTTRFSRDALAKKPLPIHNLLCEIHACASNREARQLLDASAIIVNGKEAHNKDLFTERDLLHDTYAIVRRGRKNWFVGIWE